MGFITLTEARAFVQEHMRPPTIWRSETAFHADCEDLPGPCSHFTRDAQGRIRELPDSD